MRRHSRLGRFREIPTNVLAMARVEHPGRTRDQADFRVGTALVTAGSAPETGASEEPGPLIGHLARLIAEARRRAQSPGGAMFDWIPFAVGGLVLLWGVASFAMAASGGPESGLHEVVDERRRSDAARRARRARTFQAYQALNYLLGLGVAAAAVALSPST